MCVHCFSHLLFQIIIVINKIDKTANKSQNSVNLETLDKEDIYKQLSCFEEARCGPYTKHVEDGLLSLGELNKDISGHFHNLKVYNCNISSVSHAYPKHKDVD